MANNPPPEIRVAAAQVEAWLQGQASQKATDEQFRNMSNAERIDYCRRWKQSPLDNGQRK
jgi:hypothetical protein